MKAFLGVEFQLVCCAYFLSYKTLRIFLAALSGFMYFRMNNLHKEDMNFKKIVAVDETLLNEAALKQLKAIGEEVVVYHDFPTEEEEVIRRIGNADCLLVSFRTPIRRSVLDACPNIRYIGMCCTLYNPESSNVDVIEARKRGITVLGVKDYGDEGVVEYVVSELVRLLHGFGNVRWLKESTELTGRKVGIIGLGKTGGMVAEAMRFFGAEVLYYSRTRKPEAEAKGIAYRPLADLLKEAEIVCTCLPRNNYLLGEPEFALMGDRKILVNTSVGPTFEVDALKKWLGTCKHSYYLCDATGMDVARDALKDIPNVLYTPYISGKSIQSVERLSQKALANIRTFLSEVPQV